MNGNLSAFLMLSLSKHEKGADLTRLRFPSPLEGEGLGMGGCHTRALADGPQQTHWRLVVPSRCTPIPGPSP